MVSIYDIAKRDFENGLVGDYPSALVEVLDGTLREVLLAYCEVAGLGGDTTPSLIDLLCESIVRTIDNHYDGPSYAGRLSMIKVVRQAANLAADHLPCYPH